MGGYSSAAGRPVEELSSVPASTQSGATPLTVAILASAREIEADWRELADKARVSVYQRFDWIDAYLETAAKAAGIVPAILAVRLGGRAAAIFPLGIEKTGPLRVARMLGGEHANIRMPIVDPDLATELGDASFLAGAIVDALRRSAHRVDILDLDALPAAWNGRAVPLADHPAALPARLPVGSLRLAADLATTLGSKRRAKKAKKHRAQLNALAPVGGYVFRRAGDAAGAREIFARFRADKAAWFARMGIDDSFAEPGIAEFFDALIERSWQGGEPLITLAAIEFDGAIRAIFGGGAAGGRMSGYFLSIADDEWRRITPGELLLHDLIAACCADGLESIDFGRGDERYKWSWLDSNDPQLRLMLPISALGGAVLSVVRLADAAERRLRQNQRLWRLAKQVRQRLAGRAAPSADADAAD